MSMDASSSAPETSKNSFFSSRRYYFRNSFWPLLPASVFSGTKVPPDGIRNKSWDSSLNAIEVVEEGAQIKFTIGYVDPIRIMPVDDLADFVVIASFAGGIIHFDGRYFPQLFQFLEICPGVANYFKHACADGLRVRDSVSKGPVTRSSMRRTASSRSVVVTSAKHLRSFSHPLLRQQGEHSGEASRFSLQG